ncbi:hypothetical protein SPRG_15630 [Saprolegnia parasitica CBS 223.65]|uniref:Uncharacterized protein n=1 Tax=Saprolegnia parasitica (strain CBS 223.65) TaxID=695850 RepID=A0A067BED8_SAPPC|nr:hypothetical protein SPRG_15630 [Saprolegnia parasitica CBS 223.65]KDO16704.1 hypothetical protein SPRG_15630 [Saprolegnia parasitica CBS 223.65]|eukprot:XP_012212588.1 hypothetical protein SPRG_15630 [Saprolegnia parasitica CBS 223.65]
MSSNVVAELQAAIEPEPEHIDSKEQVVVIAENANNAEAIATVNESPKLPVVDVVPVQPNEESSSVSTKLRFRYPATDTVGA